MIAITISSFNEKITNGLLNGCMKALNKSGFKTGNIDVFRVPGAFEIPGKVKSLARSTNYNCIITLGCVLKGETDHYHYISKAVTNGIMSITLEFELPYIIFGVLTCQNKDLAIARSGENLNMNKGYEAGLAAAKLLNG